MKSIRDFNYGKKIQLFNTVRTVRTDIKTIINASDLKCINPIINAIPLTPGEIFYNHPDGDVFYLCHYVPERNWDNLFDLRLKTFLLRFKDKEDDAIQYVVDYLIEHLAGHCTLIAVPSHSFPGTNSACHKVIHRVVSVIGKERDIVDGSIFLIRTNEIQSAHLGGDRDIDVHLNSISLLPCAEEKLKGRNVLLLDDVTTSGNSFKACIKIIADNVQEVKNVFCFAVGKTISNKDLKLGFIIDANDKPEEYKNLLQDFVELEADYRFVTERDKSFALNFAAELGIDSKHVISKGDTILKNSPSCPYGDPYPYLLAVQQMKIYEPFVVVITKQSKHCALAKWLGMTPLFITDVTSDNAFTANSVMMASYYLRGILTYIEDNHLNPIYKHYGDYTPVFANIHNYIKKEPDKLTLLLDKLTLLFQQKEKQKNKSFEEDFVKVHPAGSIIIHNTLGAGEVISIAPPYFTVKFIDNNGNEKIRKFEIKNFNSYFKEL